MKASDKEDVIQMYNETADSYNRMMDSEIELPIYSETFSRLFNHLGNISGPVVDTSCGSGHMLELYHNRYDATRPLIGIDLSPRMIEIASSRLDAGVKTYVGDMRSLEMLPSGASAALINFFAIHHLNINDLLPTFQEWFRVLCKKGYLCLAAWEGTGPLDYGDASDIVALKFPQKEIESLILEAGFDVGRSVVEHIEELQLDAVYLEATKP